MNEEIHIAGQSAFTNQTTLCPLGILVVAILGVCMLLLPRRWSALPLLMMACYVSAAQRIVVAGLDFDFMRIMVLFGFTRVTLRKEYVHFSWNPLDIAMLLWITSSMFFFIIQQGTFSAVINRLGFAFDAFGMYFLFRCLIRNWIDVDRVILGCICIGISVSVFFLFENRTGRNLFSIFGGVAPITWAREGKLRCQGAYSHPILAGCFWASLLPLVVAYWWKSKKEKIRVVIALAALMIIIICCASSTPIMGVLAAMIGGVFFYFRFSMHIIRWGVLLMVIALHMVMNMPVWHLISRVSAVSGSTGWHRYNLINQAIINFDDWWFSGCSGYTVEAWGVYAGDITNQYLLEGITGGLFTMCFFIAIITIAFRQVGHLWRSQAQHPYRLALSWGLGVSLFVHCVNFVGVAYFGQIWILWYLLVAIIGSMSLQTKPLRTPASRKKVLHYGNLPTLRSWQ